MQRTIDAHTALRNLVVWLDPKHPDHDAMVEAEYENAINDEEHPTSVRVLQRLIDEAKSIL